MALDQADHGEPMPDPEPRPSRTLGGWDGQVRIAPDFDNPLPEFASPD
jgi:hypothetical protein